MTLNSGDILGGRYRIVKLVGQGGFGAVYRAWDTSLKVPVAVKENLDTSPEAQRQFEHEAQLLAPLRHPNLPRVSDHFFVPGQGQYLVMDFVEGKSLDVLLAERGGPLGEGAVLPWINQVCDALNYLHTRTPPVIHRDIKPQNIIITADGRAMLVDFGISKAYDPSTTTTRGARAVTPGFSPPEQYGMGKTDARSDVYALGATLYTLLTGQPPPESVALVAGGEALTPVRRANPGVSATTEAAIAAAMALSASQRLGNAAALRTALAGGIVGDGEGRAARVATTGRRGRPLPWLWLAVVGLIVVAGGAVYWITRDNGATTSIQPTPADTTLVTGAEAATEATETLTVAATEPSSTVVEITPAATKTAEPTAAQPFQAAATTPEPEGTTTSANRRIVSLPEGTNFWVVRVPAGSFLMGADDEDSDADEAPIHEVRLDEFWIDELEVTNADYAIFTANTAYVTTDERDGAGDTVLTGHFEAVRGANWRQPQGPGRDLSGREFQPVTLVSWEDARAYCDWASGRLPTEAEWEYAARGPNALTFSWGNSFDEAQVNYCDRNCPLPWADEAADDGFRFMTDVATFPGNVSWVGAFDMAGNVWEWTADWYDEHYYDNSPAENPPGPAQVSEGGKTVRGGAWSSERQGVRSAVRVSVLPQNGHFDVGFRCVHDPESLAALDAIAPKFDVTTPALAAGATAVTSDPAGSENVRVYVPAGAFRMGSEDGNNDERPIHDVSLAAFWLDRTEVSNARFAAFVTAEGYETAAERQGWGYLFDGGNWDPVNGASWRQPQGPGSDIDGLDDHPVVMVNRADAAAFCAWAGGRLPTEAEWEYAARGPDSRLWAWGNEFLPDRANYCDHDCSASWADLNVDDGYTYTAPVESYLAGASWVGALNMTGNVWEWVSDWYAADYYGDSPAANPPGPASGERGILRGGSWVFEPRRNRTTDRNSTDPTFAIDDFGIRCAYDADGSAAP